MTIPIQTPQIGATQAVPRQPNFLEQAAPILEAMAQQRLAQAQAENVRGLAEERRIKAIQAAQDLQDQADAAKAFYMHLSGAQEVAKPTRAGADGTMPHPGPKESHPLTARPDIVRGLSPGALEYYGKHLSDYNANVTQVMQATETHARSELATAQAAMLGQQNAADEATRTILQRYGPQLSTPTGQRRALAEIAATAGPDQANKLANAFNVGSGRYAHYAGPDGFLYIIDTTTGDVRQSKAVGQKIPNALNQEAIRRGAQTIVELLDEQHNIVQTSGIAGSKNPSPAQLLQTGRVLGLSTEAVANMFRTDPQQLTQMLKTRFAHNYVGLLPHSRSAANLLTNLTESYWAPAGSSDATLQRAERDRLRLRAVMQGVASGNITDLTRIPGYADALRAAAMEGAQPQSDPNAPTPNPLDWQQGIPPQ